MPREQCQTRKLADADVTSLCFSCVNRPSCAKAVASEVIGEAAEPGIRRIHIIGGCDEYDGPGDRDLRPTLWEAQAIDLCCGCPSSEKDGCRTNDALDRLARAARKGGGNLRPVMICCTSTGERLYQIAEPSAK